MNRFKKMSESSFAHLSIHTCLRHLFRTVSTVVIALMAFLHAVPGHAQLTASAEVKTSSVTTVPPKVGSLADDGIRPFHVHVPESALVDLRQRLAAARLPDQETVTSSRRARTSRLPCMARNPRKAQKNTSPFV
jgi:hypothetical protein